MRGMEHALDRRTLIGIAERVDLPEWGVTRMRAKIDTGARTSALHVDDVEELGPDRVRFAIVLHRKKHDERVVVEAPIVRRGRVRSSTGRVQMRIFVSTRVVIGGVDKEVEISLASRGRMIYRMLLGRSALASDFLVDPSRRYVATPEKRKKKKKKKATDKTTETITKSSPTTSKKKKKTTGKKAPTKPASRRTAAKKRKTTSPQADGAGLRRKP